MRKRNCYDTFYISRAFFEPLERKNIIKSREICLNERNTLSSYAKIICKWKKQKNDYGPIKWEKNPFWIMTGTKFLKHVLHTQNRRKIFFARALTYWIVDVYTVSRWQKGTFTVRGVKKNRSKLKLRMTFKMSRQCLKKALSRKKLGELVLPSIFALHRKRLIGGKLWNRNLLLKED